MAGRGFVGNGRGDALGGGSPFLYDGTFQACPINTCYPTTAVSCMRPRICIPLYGQHTKPLYG